jgi:hypothetical protein
MVGAGAAGRAEVCEDSKALSGTVWECTKMQLNRNRISVAGFMGMNAII